MNISNQSLTQVVRYNLGLHQQRKQIAVKHMASGERVNQAKEGPAAAAIANRMTARTQGLTQAMRNASDGLALAARLESSLEDINNELQHIRKSTVGALNGTLSDIDRATIGRDIQNSLDTIDRIAERTQFNGMHLLDGSRQRVSIQVGTDDGDRLYIDLERMNTQALGLAPEEHAEPVADTLEPNEPPPMSAPAFQANGRTADADAVFAFMAGGFQVYGYEAVQGADGSLYVRDEDYNYYAVYSSKVTDAGGAINGPEAPSGGDTVELGFNPWAPVAAPEGFSTTPRATTADAPSENASTNETPAAPSRLLSLEAIDHAIQQVDRFRGYLGATENRIDSALATILEQKNAVVAARSRVLDADYAHESAQLASAQLLENAGISVLAQANQARSTIVALLG
ncbi:Flagellin protein [Salinisphaera shabanensis E1L3A]|uniref:Flagellin n=1 Tax=Salinisphaera shabanensis E1L3A TaxID=1033802 RepID=U2EHB7_9GAMM|nr:flagellin [Salinisphaera shabanensis]ERJ17787.1 Flagellin protein [Salinisphaera shabanensis E1L3A]